MSTLVDLELKAKEAFVDDNFELAVDLYSQAIELDRKNADLYADRAQANIKLGNFTGAVSDANKAIEFNPSLPKAYLRKGTACLKLEEYQTAKTALEHGVSLAPGDARFINLIKKCDECIHEETRGLQKPIESSVSPSSVSPAAGSQTADIISSDIICKESAHPMPTPEVISKPRYRHDYYNSPTHVVLTIFVKKIPPENVHVEFGEQILSVSIDIPGEEAYHFQPRLFGKILPEKCKYEVLSTKIEIRLAKAENIVWTSLEFCQERSISQRTSTSAPKSDKLVSPYSKTKVDWNKLEAQVKKEEKDEKLDGDAGLNKFFREIYGDADEDTRRAMQKSFVESNGTVLSTNWKEVGAKKIEEAPPDGMELKKWEH